ncbi:MAG: hypothetical protein COT24_01685 [Candidatus Kerfeldbacteria bacterium CG08_land_8_20_14_0_20_40_16]|uniref:Small-conductance mechanosensitive ion channel n=1 Tax=Candidatus Kerfeldbacteria bacterium CG08_land_8_20_14_0_20_40_16 TaxID=2014244 RepID=A0A2H0YWE7_9BACT|nr:MAG: hypothetical protein COT24_01685 [Candidatus Kerfeldbacteria bacterium CG08_land_8_20_14_0_20_40_16]
MYTMQSWGDTIASSFQDLWTRFINFLPSLLGALLVVVIGWLIAAGIGKLITEVLKKLWLDKAIKKTRINELFEKAGVPFNVSNAIGFLVKWFLILVSILAAADILNLDQVTAFLNRVLLYIPNVVIAVIILLFGALFASFIAQIIEGAVKAARLTTGHFLAAIARWSIIIFSILAALVQLGIAASLLEILFTGLVAMIAIAGGLAFGLGGRGQAEKILGQIEKDLKHKDPSSSEN